MSTYDASTAFGTEAQVQRDFLRQVFAWMFLALALTTGVAVLFHNGTTALWIYQHPTIFYIALAAQLVSVIALRFILVSQHVSVAVAAFLFFLYAALVGAVFSVLLDAYTTDSVIGAFAGACGVFGGMAVLGYTTNADLSRFGPILFGAVWGMVAASIVFIFVGGHALNLIIGYLGVIVFSGLTAYDMQNLKKLRAGQPIRGRFSRGRTVSLAEDGASNEKLAILGALWLFLDFINLFISLLRIFGNQR